MMMIRKHPGILRGAPALLRLGRGASPSVSKITRYITLIGLFAGFALVPMPAGAEEPVAGSALLGNGIAASAWVPHSHARNTMVPTRQASAPSEEPAATAQGMRPFTPYRNGAVDKYIDLFGRKWRKATENGYARAGRYIPMIRRILAEEGVPEEFAFLPGVESNFNPQARSWAGAAGLWQFTAPTGRLFGLRVWWPWYDERLDPEKSTRAAARLLAYLYDRYESWELALAAYNCGEARVNVALASASARREAHNYWELALPTETRNYVPAFLAMVELYGNPKKHGLDKVAQETFRVTEVVEIRKAISLESVARRISMPTEELIELNPAWVRRMVPNFKRGQGRLHLPPGQGAVLMASLAKAPYVHKEKWVVHRVQRGDTLSRIANAYGVGLNDLEMLNGFHRHSFIYPGQKLLVPQTRNDS